MPGPRPAENKIFYRREKEQRVKIEFRCNFLLARLFDFDFSATNSMILSCAHTRFFLGVDIAFVIALLVLGNFTHASAYKQIGLSKFKSRD